MTDENAALIERMKRGGRLNPDDPHPYVAPRVGVEQHGTRSYPSGACAICGGSEYSAVHIVHGPGK